ncbi:MAG: hypothetical protein RIR73_1678 [Chloroflexota bacterium]
MPSVARIGSRTYAFPIDLTHEEDGSWSVVFSDLPGCVTWGDSREEALANAHEAATLHIEGLREHGDPVPEPSNARKDQEVIFVKA